MTKSMKVAVSIPDPVFAQGEALAKRLKLSRSKLYAKALDAFVADNSEDELTDFANALADAIIDGGAGDDDLAQFRRSASRNALKHTEW
jgi:metal-responsive CopG/Arc/MetJ family transcriptional regulator